MINKDKLKEYAEKLMFRLEEEQYDTLLKEFDITSVQYIGKMSTYRVTKEFEHGD